MEESEKKKMFEEILNDDDVREDCGRELRSMELRAYSSVMDALRADGCLDKEKKGVLDNLRKYFNISEARHIAECRRVNSNEKILEMAERLQDVDSETADETWTVESYGVFPPLPAFHRRPAGDRGPFPRNINVAKEGEPPPDQDMPYPISHLIRGLDITKFKPVSEEVANLAKLKWNARVKKIHKKVQTKVSSTIQSRHGGTMVEIGSSDESEADLRNHHEHDERHSPDIIDVGSSPGKNNRGTTRRVITRTTRGPPPRRKSSLDERNSKQVLPPPPSRLGTRKGNFGKGKFPKIKFVKRPRASTPEEVSSDEEVARHNEAKINHGSPSSSQSASFAPKPTIRITAPPSKSSTAMGGRGRGIRVRGRGMSRGRGRGKMLINPSYANQSISPARSESVKRSQANSAPINKAFKAQKPKKPKPVSLSRRKSRLKEKEDDEMIVEWNDDEDDALIMSNKHVPIKKRKLVQDEPQSDEDLETDTGNPRNHHGGKYHLENGESSHKEGIIGRGHPHHHQQSSYLSPPNDSHHHHHGGRLDVPHNNYHHRSPQLSGEETDSASEKGSISGSRINLESPGSHSNASSPPPPPPGGRQKQRLKSPLHPTPQLPRVSIPPPVFSTSLSAAQKKRPQKQMSVVDSLNLHLPTTPTASSLACSSTRRPCMPTGSSIFSNQAILARAGGSPGILQKATPHILSNSKTIQRTYVPTSSSTGGAGNQGGGGGMCVTLGGGATINISSNSLVSSSGTQQILTSGGVQVQSNIMTGALTSSASGVLQLPGSGSSNTIAMSPGQSPIILVQKASNNCNLTTNAIGLQSNTIPSKTGSRAVILRRTTTQPHHQLPHSQGNVVYLDVQNKSISNQIHPFLQPVSRILTTPSEMSVLNIQSGHQSSPTVVFKTASAPTVAPTTMSSGSHRKQKFVGNNELVFTTLPNTVPAGNFRTGQNDTQMAQIEAEMLEMEQEIAYEEEVVTTSPVDVVVSPPRSLNTNNVYNIPISRSASAISSVSSDNNISNASSSSNVSDSYAISIDQQSLQQISNVSNNSGNVKIMNSNFSGGMGGDAQNQINNSQFSQNMGEDIFQTALKSSGIVFTDQQFYDVEEMCQNVDNQQQQHSVDVVNHIIVGNQENGSKQ